MKRWAIAAFAISLAGALAGCGTAATEPIASSAVQASATVAPSQVLRTPATDFTVRVARTEPIASSAAQPSATVAPSPVLRTPATDFTVRVARVDGGQLVFSDFRLSEQKPRATVLYFSFVG